MATQRSGAKQKNRLPKSICSKYLRTTKEQFDCYVSFSEQHPEIKYNRKDPLNPKRMANLWDELSCRLNSLKGPTRTPHKWKHSLAQWKNQLRCRARKAKAQRLANDVGPLVKKEFSDCEEREIRSWGPTVVDGIADVSTLGLTEESNNCDGEVGKCYDSDTTAPHSSESAAIYTPSKCSFEGSSSSTPSSAKKRKTDTEQLCRSLLSILEAQQKKDEHYRIESLACMQSVATAMNNVASAIVTLAQTIAKKNGRN